MTERRWSAEEIAARVQKIAPCTEQSCHDCDKQTADLVEIIRQLRREQKEDREAIRDIWSWVPVLAKERLVIEQPVIERAFEGEPSR